MIKSPIRILYFWNTRRRLRGYHALKKTNSLWKLNHINEELTAATIINNGHYSRFLFGDIVVDVEPVIRQFVLKKFAGLRLNKKILYYKGINKPLIYPLPDTWLKVIEKNGFNVDKISSTILWKIYVLIFLLLGICTIFRSLGRNVKAMFFSDILKENYVFFDSLSLNNLPRKDYSGDQFNIITWYLQWHSRFSDLDAIYHTFRTEDINLKGDILLASIPSVILPLANFKSSLLYLVWSVIAIFKAFCDFLFGNWWGALLLSEISDRKLISLQEPRYLAKQYFFHNSNWIYRPLWTYDAEKLGAIITLYFYSTNIEPLKYNGNPAYGYSSMSWPHYLVWDIYQANFVRKVVNSKKIDIVGPVWFSDSMASIKPINSKKIITIFDVQPVRDSFYKSLGIDFDYYTVKNVSKFILNIYDVLKKIDCVVILKRKRDIGKLSHIAYRNLIKELSNSERFIIEDSNVSSRLLIDKSDLVISMPYTSTALIAKERNKPSVYYDPGGILMKGASASHGIPIISSKQELHKWIINNI